jgi:hypothetical protein
MMPNTDDLLEAAEELWLAYDASAAGTLGRKFTIHGKFFRLKQAIDKARGGEKGIAGPDWHAVANKLEEENQRLKAELECRAMWAGRVYEFLAVVEQTYLMRHTPKNQKKLKAILSDKEGKKAWEEYQLSKAIIEAAKLLELKIKSLSEQLEEQRGERSLLHD